MVFAEIVNIKIAKHMDTLKEIKDGVLVIYFTGNLLGEHVNGPILEEVKHSIEAGNKRVVFNLKDLKFINSTGFGMFMSAMARLRNVGGELILAEVPEKVLALLTMMKLDAVFFISDSEADALDRLKLLK